MTDRLRVFFCPFAFPVSFFFLSHEFCFPWAIRDVYRRLGGQALQNELSTNPENVHRVHLPYPAFLLRHPHQVCSMSVELPTPRRRVDHAIRQSW